MHTRTDAELLNDYVSTGDEAAFGELVTRHGAFVHRTCLRLLKDAHEAEDACQAVFLVLARKARRLRGGDLSAWLYRVGQLVATETARKRMRRAQREERYAADEPGSGEAPVLEETDRQAVLDAVDAELMALSGANREAVLLRYLRGHSQEEAARLAGCSVSALSVRASRGIEAIRRRLARRGIVLGASVLAAALESEAQAAIPETVLASTMAAVKAYAAGAAATGLPGVALGAQTGAVSANVVALTKGVLNMMFWNSVKIGVAATVAVAVAVTTGVVAATQMAARNDSSAPAPGTVVSKGVTPGAVAADKVLVPRRGQIAATVQLPRPAPWVTRLLWTKDGKQVLVVIDPAIKVNNGSISKEGPDENDILAVNLETKETRQLFTKAGNPLPMEGNRLLVPLEGKLLLIEDLGLGARKELPGKQWFLPYVSLNGRYAVYLSGAMGESYDTAAIRLVTADGVVKDLVFPAEASPGTGLRQVRSPRYWTPDGRLFLASTWVKEGESTAKATWTYWLYDPESNRFEKTDSLPRHGPPYTRTGWGKIMLHDGSWLAVTPEPRFERPVRSPTKPGGPLLGGGAGGDARSTTNRMDGSMPAPPHGVMDDTKVENSSGTIEFLDVAGRTLRKVALDTQATGGSSLFAHAVSADGRYLLASTFTTVQFLSGQPFPKLQKALLIDLQTGKPLPNFEIDAAQYGMRTAFTAVMSASREVLVVNQPKGNPASFLFSFPFDGGAPADCGKALALPVSGMDWQNTAAFGDIDQMNSRRMDRDRIAMVIQPRNWANVQDPKYHNEPRRLLVFWNSAQPVLAFSSKGLPDQPTNITWNPTGECFAFTAGAVLHVWRTEP